jgi:hypothetical protein
MMMRASLSLLKKTLLNPHPTRRRSMCEVLLLGQMKLGGWLLVVSEMLGTVKKYNSPIDFRRASLCSRMAFLSRSLRSFSSRSFASRIADEALKPSKGLSNCSVPVTGAWAGVEKSISRPSSACGDRGVFRDFLGDGLRLEFRLRA